ncbi:PulJ/GspJ family protein [Ignatzschineria sp. LJL83]
MQMMRSGSIESGQGLMGVLVALAILSLLMIGITSIMARLVESSEEVKGKIEILEVMHEAEDFFRKEFQKLQFVPYCTELLPFYSEMLIGEGVSPLYRDYLQQSIQVSKSRIEDREAVLDMSNLRGSGVGRYAPTPRKNVTGVVLGSDIVQVVGLLPTDLNLKGRFVEETTTSNLIGVRNLVFYITDCHSSMVLRSQRGSSGFELTAKDYKNLLGSFNLEHLHIYIVQEYFFYVQLQAGKASLVVDALDGQVFLRMPDIIDLKVDLQSNGVLSLHLLGARTSTKSKETNLVEREGYYRNVENTDAVIYRHLLIRLES